MSFIKVTKDAEKVKSILDMVELIGWRIRKEDRNKFLPLILSDYYEVIKELTTAILLCDGFKTLSHMDLVEYLKKNYKEFDENDILIMNRLRILRNKISYEGFKIPSNYLLDNETSFLQIIKKLKLLINKKLKK